MREEGAASLGLGVKSHTKIFPETRRDTQFQDSTARWRSGPALGSHQGKGAQVSIMPNLRVVKL